MTELAKSLSKLICVITVKTGEDGKMFGTVTSGMIADQLKTQFDVTLDKRKIHLEQPIRALGDHEIELRLHADVTTTLKVRVESTTPPPALPVVPAAEAKKEEAKTEKRGRRPEAPHGKPETGEKKAYGPKGDGLRDRREAPRPRRLPLQDKHRSRQKRSELWIRRASPILATRRIGSAALAPSASPVLYRPVRSTGLLLALGGSICSSPFCASNNCFACSGVIWAIF